MKYLVIIFLSFTGIIPTAYAFDEECCNPWFASGAFGISSYSNVANNQGKNAVGRLSFGKALLTDTYLQLSLEAGIQSGTTQRLAFSKEDIDLLGGVPIEVQLRPMLDVLMGIKTETFIDIPLFTSLKGGFAYRQMQSESWNINNVTRFSPEIQAGIGYRINEKASINLMYQYIWGNNPTLLVNPIAETGVLNNIPSQQALMLGFSFNFQ